jgi:hypothetical protein
MGQWICCGETYQVGGRPFEAAFKIESPSDLTIEDSTCISIAMNAGFWDTYHRAFPSRGDVSTLTVLGPSGTDFGGTMSVTAGVPVDPKSREFALEPGPVTFVISGAGGVVANGDLTCTTPTGHER